MPRHHLLPMLATLALLGCADASVRDAQVGSVVTPGNTQVPLPPGDWHLLASANEESGSFGNGGPSYQHAFRGYYARVADGRITQLAVVSTSRDAPSVSGYVTGGDCLNPTSGDYTYFNDVAGSTANAIDCVRVTGNRIFRPPSRTSDKLYVAAYAAAAAYGGIAGRSVWVNFAEAHSGRYVNYSMYFMPGRNGVADRAAAARVDAMPADARAYVDGVVAWAKQFRPAVRAGTDHLL